jgi:LysM repeat protein
MKQNERILVFAVASFLAIILVVAVLFGREEGPKQQQNANQPVGLRELVNPAQPKPAVDVQTPTEQPLAAPKPLLSADLVAQKLGPSRRDQNPAWRAVRVRQGDTFEKIAKVWCVGREPLAEVVDEIKHANETTTILRPGQEVLVPWVEDEALLAALEAQRPKPVGGAAEAGQSGQAGAAVPANASGLPLGGNTATVAAMLGNRGAGGNISVGGDAPVGAGAKPVTPAGQPVTSPVTSPVTTPVTTPVPSVPAGTKPYVVKQGDSLWRIAERLYGKKNADRMVAEIKRLNPGRTDVLHPDDRLVVPDVPAAPAAAPAPVRTTGT